MSEADAPDVPDAPDGAGSPRPMPVRQGLPSARGAPIPARPGGDSKGGSSRPTPVRRAMETAREGPATIEPRSTEVTTREGHEWLVRVEGRATTGLAPDRGAPLLLLTFARAADPGEPLLEALGVARRLDEMTHDQLLDLLENARPVQKEWRAKELFPKTRQGGKPRR